MGRGRGGRRQAFNTCAPGATADLPAGSVFVLPTFRRCPYPLPGVWSGSTIQILSPVSFLVKLSPAALTSSSAMSPLNV